MKFTHIERRLCQRYGIIPDTFDINNILDQIENEAATFLHLGAGYAEIWLVLLSNGLKARSVYSPKKKCILTFLPIRISDQELK